MISIRKTLLLLLSSLLAISVAQAQSEKGKGYIDRNPQDVARQALDPTDGWAAFGGTTTGGSAADPDHVFYVHNRQELVAALNNLDTTPKIIFVIGNIDANVDDNNQPLTCADYQRNGYTLEGYLATYDPAVWGRTQVPSGPMEQARVASQQAQQGRVRIRVGSNTTILGMDKYAIIRGAWFDVRTTGTTNIIIRNLTFQDTYDCFPQWDPTDGSLGNWNSQYDSISIRNATHVWIDHNQFEDLTTSDSFAPLYFGRIYQQHDGELDITNAADLVTVSWNRFLNHDKVSLVGSSDSGSTANGDRGKLRITFHHNYYEGTGQRTPRVRFGKVHIYNNMYRIQADPSHPEYQYSWGVGIESAIYAENNFFRTDDSVTPDQFISVFKGTAIHATGTRVNGNPNKNLVDVVAAYNALNDPDLGTDVGWTPTLVYNLEDTRDFWPMVQAHAGPFDLQDK